MKKNIRSLALLCLSVCVSTTVSAQSEITMTKKEFLDNQIKMFNQLEEMQDKMSKQSEASIKSTMSADDFKQYQKDKEKAEQEELKVAADCLGVSTEKVKSITETVNAQALIDAVDSCSSLLPESITLTGMDMSKVAGLEKYNACNEEFIAKKSGIPLEKYKQCAAQQQR